MVFCNFYTFFVIVKKEYILYEVFFKGERECGGFPKKYEFTGCFLRNSKQKKLIS